MSDKSSNLSKTLKQPSSLKLDKKIENFLPPDTSKKIKQKSKSLLAWNIFHLLFSVAILIILIYYLIDLEDTKNSFSQMSNKPAGEFAVSVSVTSDSSLNQCTINGVRNSQCSYPASTINEAVNICNTFSSICDRFYYNEISKQMTMISLDAPLRSSSNSISVFTRQNGVTYETSGPTSIASSGSGNVSMGSAKVSENTQSLGSGTFTGSTNNPQNSSSSGATTGGSNLGTTVSGSGY